MLRQSFPDLKTGWWCAVYEHILRSISTKFLTARSLRQEYCLVECEAASSYRETLMLQSNLGIHLHLSSLLPWIQRQQVPSKRWYLSTNPNGVTSQKNIFHNAAMRTATVTSVLRAKRTGTAVPWYAINVHGEVEELFRCFSTLTVDDGQWLASCPGQLTLCSVQTAVSARPDRKAMKVNSSNVWNKTLTYRRHNGGGFGL